MRDVWLVDFDDTLASGPVTLGYAEVLPEFIRSHGLPYDRDMMERSVLVAQERASQTTELAPIIDAFFDAMQWPKSLQETLLAQVMDSYEPQLYQDTLEFLDALKQAGKMVVVLSNNPRTVAHAEFVGITRLVDDIVTPRMLPGAKPKPDPSLWDALGVRVPELRAENAVIVGDDPWSDLAFAEACGVPAWLLDRHDRFASIQLPANSQRVLSLDDIGIV